MRLRAQRSGSLNCQARAWYVTARFAYTRFAYRRRRPPGLCVSACVCACVCVCVCVCMCCMQVGMVGLKRYSDTEAELVRLSVHKDARGQGLGLQLCKVRYSIAEHVKHYCRQSTVNKCPHTQQVPPHTHSSCPFQLPLYAAQTQTCIQHVCTGLQGCKRPTAARMCVCVSTSCVCVCPQHLIAQAKAHGYKRVFLYTSTARQAALQVYLRLGWTIAQVGLPMLNHARCNKHNVWLRTYKQQSNGHPAWKVPGCGRCLLLRHACDLPCM